MFIIDLLKELVKFTAVKVFISLMLAILTTYVVSNQIDTDEKTSSKIESADQKAETQLAKEGVRHPASVERKNARGNTPLFKADAKVTAYNKSNFTNTSSDENEIDQKRSRGRMVNQDASMSYDRTSYDESPRYERSAQEASGEVTPGREVASTGSENNTNNENNINNVNDGIGAVGQNNTSASKVNENSGEKETSTPSSVIAHNSCSANIEGGAFGNPIGIKLNCTHSSAIKYCLGKDECCDPEIEGVSFTGVVVIGPKNGNYCLSYYGESAFLERTKVNEQNYIINSTFPSLDVGHDSKFYQTTELNGMSFLSSLDFGKSNFTLGQINLKSHNPGMSGLNYDCDEIISNYVSLTVPTPVDVLAMLDAALIGANSQVEIPLRLDHLDYGQNFITSYVSNNNFVVPLHSCSTTIVTLDDFEYFQVDDSHAEVGTESVREFEGEFSSYSFIEDVPADFRIPAGAEEISYSGHLKTGLLSVFY